MKMGVKSFDVTAFTKANIIDPKNVSYQDSIDIINDELHKTRKSFIKIGWYLKHINEANMYKEDGYANINDFAHDKFKISQSTTTRLIGLCCQFSVGHDSPELDEKYLDYNISQLFEMLPMLQEKREQITPDMTIRQIRDKKNEDKNEVKEPSVDENDSEKDIPGQTSIEKDFPEYMPDDISVEPAPEQGNEYATSYKQEVDEQEIIDGEYREIDPAKEAAQKKSVIDETEESLRDEIEELADAVKSVFWGWDGQEIPYEEVEMAGKNAKEMVDAIEKLLNMLK